MPLRAIVCSLLLAVADLRTRREQVLGLIAEQLGVPENTAILGRTFDSFTTSFALLQSLDLAPIATRFALWRKPELAARLQTGQDVAGFRRSTDGEIEFSVVASFQFNEGEPAEQAMERMRAEWRSMTWPVKIGEDPALAPEAEFRERLATLREHASQLGALQVAEIQRLAVMTERGAGLLRVFLDSNQAFYGDGTNILKMCQASDSIELESSKHSGRSRGRIQTLQRQGRHLRRARR